MTPKRAATATIFLATASLVGCQAVFGLGDYVEGAGGAGAQGSGGATSSSQGGSTSTSSDGGAPPGCEFVGAAWSAVELEAAGDASETPPTLCALDASTPLALHADPPEVSCSACSCEAAGCAAPVLQCYSDSSCGAGEKQIQPFDGCASLGVEAGSCKLMATPTPSCTAVDGTPTGPAEFGRFFAFCADQQCPGTGYAHESAACVVAAGEGLACPSRFPNRVELFESGEADCPTCSCTGNCGGAPYRATNSYVFACDGITTVDVGSTTCTVVQSSIGTKRSYAQSRDEFGPSCTPSPQGPQPGAFATAGPHVVCCRAPLEPSGAGGSGGS